MIFYHAAIESQFPALPVFTSSKPDFITTCDLNHVKSQESKVPGPGRTSLPGINNITISLTKQNTENWNQCHSGCDSYYFDTSLWQETTTTELNLVCDKEWHRDIPNYAFYAGWSPLTLKLIQTDCKGQFIGSLTTGSISDTIGRQKTLLYGHLIATILFFLHLIISDVIGLAIIRFFLGPLTLLLYGFVIKWPTNLFTGIIYNLFKNWFRLLHRNDGFKLSIKTSTNLFAYEWSWASYIQCCRLFNSKLEVRILMNHKL